MRSDLTYKVLITMLLLNLTGCGGMFGKGGTQEASEKRQDPVNAVDMIRDGQERQVSEKRHNLAKAVDMIRGGQEREARYFLELVIDDTREDGVTDEALFRLALLKLNDGELGTGKSSIALLDKLRSSYQASVWTRQAAPLLSYLKGVHNIRNREREVNTLREKNLSLSRDVHGLRQTIERLKALDLELEQKIRR
ncbi:MAG: hypothetical protein PVSMB11_10810 [Desulfuromonadaceae bacterium]